MAKAKDAFRTISEVAEWLDTPTHVLRFWESKFSQIKPVKGAGGRRYYRPKDMDLLGGIKQLLHEDGLTIKGTQKLLREKGVKYVMDLGQSMTASSEAAATPAEPAKVVPLTPRPTPAPEPTSTATVQDTPPLNPPAAGAPTIDLPVHQQDLPASPPRLIGRAMAHESAIKSHAAEIAPLLDRLEAVRKRMRG